VALLLLLAAGGEVGSMYIPTGQIYGGRTQYMATSFTAPTFVVSVTGTCAAARSLAGRSTG